MPDDTGDESHSFEDHTSEVELRVRARSLPALFARAGVALAELMLGEEVDLTPPAAGAVSDAVVVTAPDREALLTAWLDELIFRAETRKAVFTRFRMVRMGDREPRPDHRHPRAGDQDRGQGRHLPPAAGLEEDGAWSATVVLDV